MLQPAAVLVEMVAEFEKKRLDGCIVLLPRLQQRKLAAGACGDGAGEVVEVGEEGAPFILTVSVHDVCEGL